MLRNMLSPAVPAIAATHVDRLLQQGLDRAGLLRNDIAGWILHAGGRDILTAIRQRVGLTEEDTRFSAAVLRDYGNVSSPCIYFVLQSALREETPGGYWWLSSFGAGFSCHGALLAVD